MDIPELIEAGAGHGDHRSVVGSAGFGRHAQRENVTAAVDEPADGAIGGPDAGLEVALTVAFRLRPYGGDSVRPVPAARGLPPAPHRIRKCAVRRRRPEWV